MLRRANTTKQNMQCHAYIERDRQGDYKRTIKINKTRDRKAYFQKLS